MNWKCWAGVFALLVLLVLGIAECVRGPLDPGHPREDVCAQGDALRTARLLDEAAASYGNGEDCSGLLNVELAAGEAEEHFATATAYASAKPATAATSKQAIDEFAAGLRLDPFDSAANLGLVAELNKELVKPALRCETGANLVRDGLLTVAGVAASAGLAGKIEACEAALAARAAQQTEATDLLSEARELDDVTKQRMAYAQALLVDANLTAARTELEASLDTESCLDRVGAWFAGVPKTLERALVWLVPLAVALFLIALIVWIAVREAAARWAWARRRFEAMGEHRGLRFFLYKAAVPRIKIAEFKGKGDGDLEGSDFTARLKGEIFESTANGPAFPFDRIELDGSLDAEVDVSAADLLAEIPATKLLGSLVKFGSKLFRRREVVLHGRLVPIADKGAGVLLCVEAGRGREKSTALWEIVYTPNPGGEGAVRWLRLVPAAAIWARWHLSWAEDPTREVDIGPWEVEALLESAQAWQLKGETGRAQTLYRAALEADQTQLTTAHNLAVIELHEGKYRRALERIEWLRDVLATGERTPCGRTPEDLKCLWPTLDPASRYTQILALAYLDGAEQPGAKTDALTRALTTAQELVETTAKELVEADERAEAAATTATKTGNRRTTKQRVKPSRAATEAEKTAARKAKSQVELEALFRVTEQPSVVVLASLRVRRGSERDKRMAVEQAVSGPSKGTAISRAELSESLGALEPWELIDDYVRRQPNLPRRTHYNLACYYTTLLRYADAEQQKRLRDLALESLSTGLIGGELIDWARHDPSLEKLRSPSDDEFEKVLEARAIKPYTPDEETADQ